MDYLNFEDTIFILNMRIKMSRDTLRLNPPPELFLEKSLDDLSFISNVLEVLVRTFVENGSRNNGNGIIDYISDTEWQFSQLLTEFSLETSPFTAQVFPEVLHKIAVLRESGNIRKKIIEESGLYSEIVQAEPVVSSAEMTGLLGGV